MSEKTPGRADYEGYFIASDGKSLVSGAPLPEWDEQAPGIRDAWEAGAQAVLNEAFPRLRAEIAELRAARDEYRDNAILHIRERDEAREQLAAADRATAEFRRQCSELAGELGAAVAKARAETVERLHRVGERDAARSDLDRMRALAAEILGDFDASRGDGFRARIGQVKMARYCERAGVTPKGRAGIEAGQ